MKVLDKELKDKLELNNDGEKQIDGYDLVA
jgi:hypothetical protein